MRPTTTRTAGGTAGGYRRCRAALLTRRPAHAGSHRTPARAPKAHPPHRAGCTWALGCATWYGGLGCALKPGKQTTEHCGVYIEHPINFRPGPALIAHHRNNGQHHPYNTWYNQPITDPPSSGKRVDGGQQDGPGCPQDGVARTSTILLVSNTVQVNAVSWGDTALR